MYTKQCFLLCLLVRVDYEAYIRVNKSLGTVMFML